MRGNLIGARITHGVGEQEWDEAKEGPSKTSIAHTDSLAGEPESGGCDSLTLLIMVLPHAYLIPSFARTSTSASEPCPPH